MFTKQSGLLDNLRPYLPEQVIDGLQALYHNCAARLFHRAPVTIEVDGQKEHVPRRKETAGWPNFYAAMNLANHSAYYDGTNNEFVGGLALNVEGPVHIEPSVHVTENSSTFEENYDVVLYVNGDIIFEGNVTYEGSTYDVTFEGDVFIEGDLTLTGGGTIYGDIIFDGDITVNGTITMSPTVTQTVVTDVQYDAATNKLQKKTISLTVLAKGTESAWTDWTGGAMTTQEHVVNVTYSTSTKKLEQTKATVTVFETTGAGAAATIETAEAC